jgi:hypothetical protein
MKCTVGLLRGEVQPMPGNGFPLRRKVVQGNLLLQLDTPIGEFKFVEIIKHALERMSERKVSEQDVLNTLRKRMRKA